LREMFGFLAEPLMETPDFEIFQWYNTSFCLSNYLFNLFSTENTNYPSLRRRYSSNCILHFISFYSSHDIVKDDSNLLEIRTKLKILRVKNPIWPNILNSDEKIPWKHTRNPIWPNIRLSPIVRFFSGKFLVWPSQKIQTTQSLFPILSRLRRWRRSSLLNHFWSAR
jgi:hypothetical protein